MKILYPVIEGDLLSQSDIKKYYSPTIDSEIRADYITYSAQKFALEVFKKESKKITNLVGSKFFTKKDLNTSFILYSLIISELFDDIVKLKPKSVTLFFLTLVTAAHQEMMKAC